MEGRGRDANAAIGIIRQMALGKVRQLTTSGLWAQEKEASPELQYHKVKVEDNGELQTIRLCKDCCNLRQGEMEEPVVNSSGGSSPLRRDREASWRQWVPRGLEQKIMDILRPRRFSPRTC